MERFKNSDHYKTKKRILVDPVSRKNPTLLSSLETLIDLIENNNTISFHHHLREGDYLLNLCLDLIEKRNLKNLTIASSAIFPHNKKLSSLIEKGIVTCIHTNYLNGDVAKTITNGHLKGKLFMHTHGGRARAIESGEIKIDLAIMAVPTVDHLGCGTGRSGKNACGAIGYAVSDILYSKKVAFVTDNYIEKLDVFDVSGCDYIVTIASIGDNSLIKSGTTKITKDPIQLKIAKDASKVIEKLGLLKNGFTMQMGAGGTSLAVCSYLKEIMIEKNIKAKFATGGITANLVSMLNENLIEDLYDVQCFDLEAVNSFKDNPRHHFMDASSYANPYEKDVFVDKLDFAILGATEFDLDFNCNVTTDSFGEIIGGSGGHSDVSHGCFVTIIVTNLIKSRLPVLKKRVHTITTPGSDIDIIVTERGIVVNPLRTDLIKLLENSNFNIVTIDTLYKTCLSITGIPKEIEKKNDVIGHVVYRDGSIISDLYKR